jgi:hypothetical protein
VTTTFLLGHVEHIGSAQDREMHGFIAGARHVAHDLGSFLGEAEPAEIGRAEGSDPRPKPVLAGSAGDFDEVPPVQRAQERQRTAFGPAGAIADLGEREPIEVFGEHLKQIERPVGGLDRASLHHRNTPVHICERWFHP